jgi:hypothetical protein
VLLAATGGLLIRDEFFGGDFAISKEGVKIHFKKKVRTSPTREFPDEVGDVLTFFLKCIFTPSLLIAKLPGHSKKVIF